MDQAASVAPSYPLGPGYWLHSASDPSLRPCCDPIGKLTNPVAAIIRLRAEATMKKGAAMTCLFLIKGGVLFTNGRDHLARQQPLRPYASTCAKLA